MEIRLQLHVQRGDTGRGMRGDVDQQPGGGPTLMASDLEQCAGPATQLGQMALESRDISRKPVIQEKRMLLHRRSVSSGGRAGYTGIACRYRRADPAGLAQQLVSAGADARHTAAHV